jgi:hypothetical protein
MFHTFGDAAASLLHESGEGGQGPDEVLLAAVQSAQNALKHFAEIFVNLKVLGSVDAVSIGDEKVGASLVVRKFQAVAVRCSIKFDDKSVFAIEEVNDVGANGNLSDKLMVFEFSVTKIVPKDLFGGRHVSTERLGA